MNAEITSVSNQAALRLIEEWLADDSGYDEKVWPILQELIEQNRLSYRSRFAESSGEPRQESKNHGPCGSETQS